MFDSNKKGVLLFIVIATVMIVIMLSTVILRIILSQSRLTHHQISRIQAQYIAKAGIVYALEMLRKGVSAGGWGYSVSPAVNSCPSPGGQVVSDPTFPSTIDSQQFRVIFCPSGSTCPPLTHPCAPPSGSDFCINSTAVYTYTP